jgi:peptidoglycan/xylan/chitin deacetylase (PgdA/CDA1 family)
VLTQVPREEAFRQIRESRERIEARTGRRVAHFAYPNGLRSDFDEAIRDYVRELGFACACTTERGANGPGADRYELRRDDLDHEPFPSFALRMSGFFEAARELRARLRPRRLARALLPRWLLLRRRAPDGRVYLTFDDGPHPMRTDRLLEILGKAGARATFFMSGTQVEAFPEVARRVVKAGHAVASHSWHHRRYAQWDFPSVWNDMRRAEDILERVCGVRARSFRPPYGHVTVSLVLCAVLRARRLVLWSLDSEDDRSRSSATVLRNCRAASAGDVVLLHDDNDAVLEALPRALDEFKERGLSFGVLEGAA